MKHAPFGARWTVLVDRGAAWHPGAGSRSTQGGTVQAPRFEVDPYWPKPLPNHWLLGSATGIAIDSRDHVYVIHLTESFTPRTETGAGPQNNNITPAGECCSLGAECSRIRSGRQPGQAAGVGPDRDYELARSERRPGDRSGREFLDWRNGWYGHAHPEVHERRQLLSPNTERRSWRRPAAAAAADTHMPASRRDADKLPAAVAVARWSRWRGRPRGSAGQHQHRVFGGATAFAFDAGAGEVYVADGRATGASRWWT